MHGMTSAEQVGMMTTITVIGIVAFVFLAMFIATAPTRQTANVNPWADMAWPTQNYREPADPSYVDELIRIRGVATVIHSPAPLPAIREPVLDATTALPSRFVPSAEPLAPVELMSDSPDMSLNSSSATASRYAMPIERLVASVRYVLPAAMPSHSATPAAHAESVGRHRALELVAA